MTDTEHERAAKIAAINDAFRKTATPMFTAALAAEGLVTMLHITQKVRAFDAFTPENDPYGEHEFGSLTHLVSEGTTPHEATIFFKIDTYADASLTYGADDPLDPKAVRIMTIMLASDY